MEKIDLQALILRRKKELLPGRDLSIMLIANHTAEHYEDLVAVLTN